MTWVLVTSWIVVSVPRLIPIASCRVLTTGAIELVVQLAAVAMG